MPVDFAAFARKPDAQVDVLEGAVLIARDAYPGLELEKERLRLDRLSEPLAGLGIEHLPAFGQARALGEYLYVTAGFRGNAEHYHEPENSFINVVLDRKLGIPITLAIVYLEVATRLGVRARGVGFPGHFLIRVDDPSGPVFVDPFFGGDILDAAALDALLKRSAPRAAVSPGMLEAVSPRQIVMRMLMNLRAIYAARAEPGRLLLVLDHLVDLMPDAADEIRDRGYLCARLGATSAAVADLRRYVAALPNAEDASQVRRAIDRLETEPSVIH
jgi:regulator of sirC expression with transglutaminase-like and TPR domain